MIAAIALALALAGCNSQRCARHSDCPLGEVCGMHAVCVAAPPEPDAGSTDAGVADPIESDAAAIDAPDSADAGVDSGP